MDSQNSSGVKASFVYPKLNFSHLSKDYLDPCYYNFHNLENCHYNS